MKNKTKKELKRAIIDYMAQISFKSFLEYNDDIYDMYESDEFVDNDFYDILEEIKNEALEHCNSDVSCDVIRDICETDECKIEVEEIKENVNNRNNDSIITNLYLKFKETLLPIKRFDFLYKDSNYTLQVGNIDIIFSEGDEFNIKKMEDIKNKYAERFVYFLEHDILITDN